MGIYSRFRHLDITDESSYEIHDLSSRTIENVKLFQNMHSDLVKNLSWEAISPFSGIAVKPLLHFGIDSDPWMHSILYEDFGKYFIIICQGLTNASHLGSVVLPNEMIILNHYKSWYFKGAYLPRIERNLPRILNFFNWKKIKSSLASSEIESNKYNILFAIGNQRVGDFIMQLLLLDELLRHPKKDIEFRIQKVIVSKSSEFMEVSDIFPELKNCLTKLNSSTHVEYYSRHFNASLISDVRVLSNKMSLNLFKSRIRSWLEHKNAIKKNMQVAEFFNGCSIIIWVSLELEKRVWAEQEHALAKIINALCKKLLMNHESIGIVLNGMTGLIAKELPENIKRTIEKEKKMAEKLISIIDRKVCLYLACGLSLSEKIILANKCNLVIAPLGSASVVPSLLLDKPGIVYAYDAEERSSFVGASTMVMNPIHIKERKELKGEVEYNTANQSYSFDWDVLFYELVDNYEFERDKFGLINARIKPSTSEKN